MIQSSTLSPFAGFLQAIGHRVFTTQSAEWFDAGPRFLLSLPFHRLLAPSEAEIRDLVRRARAVGVRFPAAADAPGRTSYQIVCDTRPYDIEQLSGNTRSKIRRGLKRCAIERVSGGEVKEGGWSAHLDTLGRQGRLGDLGALRVRWDRYWETVDQTEGMEVWVARVGDALAAYLVTVQLEDRIEFLQARSRDEYLGQYPNNALLFTLTRDMLNRPGVTEITFGLESLEPVGPLDEFKIAMGYRHRPVRQRIIFHPALRPFLRLVPLRRAVLDVADRMGRQRVAWRKFAGLLRFAEEGGI